MKATEHYFPVVLFIMMYKVVQTLKSVDKTLWCDHSIETSLAELLQFIFFAIAQINQIRLFGGIFYFDHLKE